MHPPAEPLIEASLDGARLDESPGLPRSGGHLLMRPRLTGGTPVDVAPGRYAFTSMAWDADGIRLEIRPA